MDLYCKRDTGYMGVGRQSVMEQTKHVVDAASIANVIAILAGWIPAIAGLFTIVWTLMNIVIHWGAFKAKVCGWFDRGNQA